MPDRHLMTDQAPELLPGEIDECGWVIELGESEPSHPAYWIGPSENPAYWPFGMFSDDNLKAVRFARKEDAEAVVKFTVDASHNDPRATFRIAEHSWYCPPNTRPPSERPVAAIEIERLNAVILAHIENENKLYGEIRSLRALTAERPEAAVAWRDIAETLCAVDGNGFLHEASPTQQTAYEVRAKAVAALYAIQHEEPGRETPRWRHKKRGSTYTEIGRARLQSFDPGGLVDMQELVIYRSDADGSLWARPQDEFEDGRFESLSPAQRDIGR